MMVVAGVVAESDHQGLLELMDESCSGCYCRWWHFTGDDYSWQERCNIRPQENRTELGRALQTQSTEALGVVARSAGRVVGWLKLCPASAMSKLHERRFYRSLACFEGDRSRVLVVACMLVAPASRRRGVAAKLVAAALAAARDRGADAVEALPHQTTQTCHDGELWMGPASVFLEQGFKQVGGLDIYPVLRHSLAPPATDN